MCVHLKAHDPVNKMQNAVYNACILPLLPPLHVPTSFAILAAMKDSPVTYGVSFRDSDNPHRYFATIIADLCLKRDEQLGSPMREKLTDTSSRPFSQLQPAKELLLMPFIRYI